MSIRWRSFHLALFAVATVTTGSGCDNDDGDHGSITCGGDAVCVDTPNLALRVLRRRQVRSAMKPMPASLAMACAPGYVESGARCVPELAGLRRWQSVWRVRHLRGDTKW